MNNSIDIPVEKLNEPGNLWIRPQNNQFRYSTDANKPASWLEPLPVYTASKEIKFGQPVSLATYSQEHNISTNGAREKTIIPTNSFESASFVGISIEYGNVNNKVHIQNNGEIVYEMNKKDNPKYWLPPYHKDENDNFIFDWTDADVGSTVYISKDGYTLNVDDISGGNIMSVGKLVFAPRPTEVNERQQKIIIHIQAGGDDRGVKDTSQFTIQMSPSITPTSIESNVDKILFVKVNENGLGEIIFNDESLTEDLTVSPVGAIVVKSENGICDLRQIIGKKITLIRMGLVSGNFGFNTINVGKIGLLNNGNVEFKSAKDYTIKVGIFKSSNDDEQEFLIDCRFPIESAKSSDKIGTIKPVFGPNDTPLLDIGYALVDENIHRVVFKKNDTVDTSKIDWSDLIKSCYTKDIFEFGRKIGNDYVFSRVLEEIDGKTWSPDVYDTDDTYAIFNPNTFFKFRNLYYTIGNFADNNIQQVACQIKFTQDSLNTNEECIWPEESYKIKLKAESNSDDYVLGGKGPNSTLFCNISRLVAIGNYMDGNGANIDTYDITVKVESTGQLLSPGFYQNDEGKWCGYEWFMYSNNGVSYLYMSTIPSGKEANECNGICLTNVGQKMQTSDPQENLIVTVRRRPTLYNAVYLNQYPTNNPWMPYIDGNTGNLITESAIYFGSPSKMLSQNQTNDDSATSGLSFNESGRNGKIELTTENSGRTVNLSTQVRGSTNSPIFKDKKQVIKNDGTIANTIEWEYDFSNMVTSLSSYFAPILISKKSSTEDITYSKLNYIDGDDVIQTTNYSDYLSGNKLSAIEVLDSYIFRNIKYNSDSGSTKPTISIVTNDSESDDNKYIFDELSSSLAGNKYSINKDNLSRYKDALYVDGKYINYMSFLSLVGAANKDLYKKVLRLERIIHGEDFNKNVQASTEYENDLEYINDFGLLRSSGYLKKSLVLIETKNIDALLLGQSLMPNNTYASIIDRFVIDNFYDYYSLGTLQDCYLDYNGKTFEERLNLVKDTTVKMGGNLAQWVITNHDLGLTNYIYTVYDFFKYLKEDNSYDVLEKNTFEGSYLEADKIVFKKNTRGYKSLCRDKVGYKLNNLKTDIIGTREVYEICNDEFDPNQAYYENKGSRDFLKVAVDKSQYEKNKYYIKKTIEAEYAGYPFRWPLYKDESFSELDFEYNFFSKQTYGLDDSVTIFDNNPDEVLSSFSSQSLEGITFDTISKLSFLYSCFNQEDHTLLSKMTWFSPFIVDDYSSKFKYELKRLSQTKSITAVNNKIYSAFITRDNKVTELGSLYYDAHKHILYESNAIEDVADTLTDYNNKYGIPNWQGYLLREKSENIGIRTDKSNITISFDLGHNGTYTFNVPEDEEFYKKFIFLMAQSKLIRIRNLLNNDPYNAYKMYGDFFKKDYLRSIDISTQQGVATAKASISKYIHSGLSDSDIKLLSKFSLSPIDTGPVKDYLRLGTYGTLLSEIKSLRPVEDISGTDVQKLLALVESYEAPESGNKDDINGDNSYKIITRLTRDINEVDSYDVSKLTNNGNYSEIQTGKDPWTQECGDVIPGYYVTTTTPGENGSPGTTSSIWVAPVKLSDTYREFYQSKHCDTESKFIIYHVTFNSNKYSRPITNNCQTHYDAGIARANSHKNMPTKSTGIPNQYNTDEGAFYISFEPTLLAKQEAAALKSFGSRYYSNYLVLMAFFNANTAPHSSYKYPECSNETIFYARCKYLLDMGYSVADVISYMDDRFGNTDEVSPNAVLWKDYGLIDYARAAAYGSKNIVFYNLATYKEFNDLPASMNIYADPIKSIKQGIINSGGAIDAYNDNPPLKVVWPSDTNTYGQAQESLTSSRNNINRYIDRKVSDNTTESGDTGVINLKVNQVTRLSNIEESILPDIKISDLKKFLKGDKTVCSNLGIDADTIREYNFDTEKLDTTANLVVPIVDLQDTVLYTLYEVRNMQYAQIEAQDDGRDEVISTSVVNLPKEAVIYDLVNQGLSFEVAKRYADSILVSGFDISGGFKAHPNLKRTYGLLDITYYGAPIKLDEEGEEYYISRLEGLVLHNATISRKNLDDFKLKELYDYNNIDRMIMAQSTPEYEQWFETVKVLKDYIELFFEHSDKLLRDFSVLSKAETIAIKGTTYIDDMVDKDKLKDALQSVKDSINETVSKTLPASASNAAQDSFSSKFTSLIEKIVSASVTVGESSYNVSFPNVSTLVSQFEDELKKTIVSYTKDILTNSTLKVTKNATNFDDLTNDATKGYNLEKYDPACDREESTGFQEEQYVYKELIPEYGYLYNKPADGISIRKQVDSYDINGRTFHNNVKTIIKHLPTSGDPIQKEKFIGDKIEIKEGAYLRGEQLPLPLVSLDIRPDTQMQSQRLSYKPNYEDYYCVQGDEHFDDTMSVKYVDITGVFPLIEVNNTKFSIRSIRKIILNGGVFDSIPNGLKIIPSINLFVNATYYDPNEQVGSNSDPTKLVQNFEMEFEGKKIYRNYIYNILVDPVQDQSDEWQLVNWANIDVTLANSVLNNHIRDNEKSIKQIIISDVESSGNSRQITTDKTFMRDIIENSNLFLTNKSLITDEISDKLSIIKNFGEVDDISKEVTNYVESCSNKLKHISSTDFKLIYS